MSYLITTYKSLAISILILLMTSCASGRFALIDGVLVQATNKTNLDKMHVAIVSSEISESVSKYLEDIYKETGMLASYSKIQPVMIDGKTVREASEGKLSRFTSYSNNSYYFELPPGKHSFTVHTTRPVHEVQLVEISFNFEAGHQYFLGQVSKHIQNDDSMSNLPSMWRIKFVLVDTMKMKDVTMLSEEGAQLRVVGKMCSGKIVTASKVC